MVHCALTLRTNDGDDTLNKWILDSSTMHIMCSHCHWFHTFTPLPKPINVDLGDDHIIPATGQGRILVSSITGNSRKRVVLQDTLYVPQLSGNLLSVTHFMHHRAELNFAGKVCNIVDRCGDTILTGQLCGNMLVMDITVITNESEAANITIVDTFPSEDDKAPTAAMAARTTVISTADLTTWHCRLGHLNTDTVSLMTNRDMVTGMTITRGSTLNTPCKPCVRGKQT